MHMLVCSRLVAFCRSMPDEIHGFHMQLSCSRRIVTPGAPLSRATGFRMVADAHAMQTSSGTLCAMVPASFSIRACLSGSLIGIGRGLTTAPLPHHRTYGSRIRRFGRLSRGDTSPQPERRLPACQPRIHPRSPSIAPTPRRMPSRRSIPGHDSLPPFRPSARSRGPTMPSADGCRPVGLGLPPRRISLGCESRRSPRSAEIVRA